jgi:hypothetical protein
VEQYQYIRLLFSEEIIKKLLNSNLTCGRSIRGRKDNDYIRDKYLKG